MPTLNTRLDFRLTPQLKELIQQAAALLGQSVTDFATSTLAEKAAQVIQQNATTTLSNRDRDIFLAMLDSDAEPNDALKRAARRFNKRHG